MFKHVTIEYLNSFFIVIEFLRNLFMSTFYQPGTTKTRQKLYEKIPGIISGNYNRKHINV
jgi:hypothetical protein